MFASKDLFFTRTSGAYQISRSVRFRSSATAYFNRTVASTTYTYTLSLWVKRGKLGVEQILTTSRASGAGNTSYFEFNASDQLLFVSDAVTIFTTTAVYRDPSAWYHIVLKVTQSGAVVCYVNNQQVATGTASATSFLWNSGGTYTNVFGVYGQLLTAPFDGYMTEINYIDGQALTPSSFGQTNTITGVWQPIKYTGTYGTNGFYLNFSDNSAATAAAIGKDYSGNANNWTPNNISVTAGITYDSMLDVPTNYADGGNGRGNYAVLNPLTPTHPPYSDGNLRIINGTTYGIASIGMTSGKWYCEMYVNAVGGESSCGVSNSGNGGSGYVGSDATSWGYYSNGNKYTNGSGSAYGASFTTGDTVAIAFDADAGTLTFYKNGTTQGTAFTGLTSGPYYFSFEGRNVTQNDVSITFGQRPFTYTPPSGYVALNTQNLPTPTISNGANYMAATIYTGTGSSLTIANTVNGISFYPDFVWVKGRSGATDHALYDSVRGTTKDLASNTTAAETTQATGLTAFSSTGFTVGALAKMNTNAATYVGWQWLANAGSSSSNTNGSITSTVSVNATAGFSVVTYTGTGSNATVGHGLGVAPQMVIVKNRGGVYSWLVYHKFMATSSPATWYMSLNQTSAASNGANIWINDPTSTVFTVSGTYPEVNASTNTYVAYCFAPVTGYSKFGSYTGNASTDGPFVYCGFRPRFVMFKSTSGPRNWAILDSGRNPSNVANFDLYPNANYAEVTQSTVDFLSNGFKLRVTDSDFNAAETYIFAAFAENPFKNSLAR